MCNKRQLVCFISLALFFAPRARLFFNPLKLQTARRSTHHFNGAPRRKPKPTEDVGPLLKDRLCFYLRSVPECEWRALRNKERAVSPAEIFSR